MENTAHKDLPSQKEKMAGEPQNQQMKGGRNDVEPNVEAAPSLSSVDLMEIEPFASPQIDGP